MSVISKYATYSSFSIIRNFLPNPLLSVLINKAFIKSCSRNEQSPTCEVVHETKLTSDISFPTDSLLAQLAERGTDDLEVVVSILDGDIFLFYFSSSMLAGFCHELAGNFQLCKNSIVSCRHFL